MDKINGQLQEDYWKALEELQVTSGAGWDVKNIMPGMKHNSMKINLIVKL